ncbi:MAG: pyridoxal-phosphate dependent enzyme, partial [bacterium]
MKKLSAASSLYDGIIEDAAFVLDFVTRTPIIRLPWLDAPGRTVWAKLENKQMTNSFKVRGAFNAARKIDPSLPLVTASAGNHGLALAYVADHLKRKSKIFVPANASEIKLKRLINMG